MSVKKKVILDVDTGSDDAVAIMSAVLCEELEVLGIIATFGNQPLKYTLPNTLRVVEFLKCNVPVYRGFGVPIAKDLTPSRNKNVNTDYTVLERVVNGKVLAIHEKELPLPGPTIAEQPEHAVTWLLRTLKETKEKITLIPVGPMTNVATVLRMDPSAAENIEEIVAMGGGVYVHNITPCAEINFYNDPEAAKIVLNSGVPVTLVTLDATHSSWFGYEEADQIAAVGTPAAEFAANLLRHRISSANRLGIRKEQKSALHDVLAVCSVIDKSILTDLRHEKCDVDIGGNYADGALIVDRRPVARLDLPTYIAYKADKDKLLSMLCRHLSNMKAQEDI
ncbi:MAG TPA: nucleoside hydrolase [Clostridiaceae bacterium]|nr:nucleoside hydrolase [Clostridiaceae bacterium]